MAGASETNRYDAIVIGGGHNGLVAAAYLGKAGLRTVVLERRPTVGGAAATSELAPGARVPTLAHTVGRLRPSVVRDLDLKRHGLSLVGPEVRAFAPGPDGDAIVLWSDVARTAEGLRARSAADADAYASFDGLVRALSGFLGEIAGRTPPDIESPGLGDALAGLQLGRTFRGLGRDDGRTITRVLPMAIADFVAESFETDALQAAIAWRGVQYTSMGPWSAGTTAVLLTDSAGNDGGAAGQTVFARGGPGALAAALEAAAREAGVEIRTDAEVSAVTSRDGAGDGRRPRRWRGDHGTCRRRRHRPEATSHRPGRSRRHRPEPALAGGQHPDAGHGRQGQPRALRAARLPGRSRRRQAPPRSHPDRARHRCDGARPRRGQVRPLLGRADDGGDDPVARRSVARRGRGAGHARDERHRPGDAVQPPRRQLGRRSRRLRRSRGQDARFVRARAGRRS